MCCDNVSVEEILAKIKNQTVIRAGMSRHVFPHFWVIQRHTRSCLFFVCFKHTRPTCGQVFCESFSYRGSLSVDSQNERKHDGRSRHAFNVRLQAPV